MRPKRKQPLILNFKDTSCQANAGQEVRETQEELAILETNLTGESEGIRMTEGPGGSSSIWRMVSLRLGRPLYTIKYLGSTPAQNH